MLLRIALLCRDGPFLISGTDVMAVSIVLSVIRPYQLLEKKKVENAGTLICPFVVHVSRIRLREMKGSLTFLDGRVQLSAHNVKISVVWQLEIVDTGHDAGKVVIGRVGRFARLADDGEHWSQTLEA